jgi:hypothetical protein
MTDSPTPRLFEKGCKKPESSGRKPGVSNKITKDVRHMVYTALRRAGGEDYLLAQARENPTAFLSLLKSVMPKKPLFDEEAKRAIVITHRIIRDGNDAVPSVAHKVLPALEVIQDAPLTPLARDTDTRKLT